MLLNTKQKSQFLRCYLLNQGNRCRNYRKITLTMEDSRLSNDHKHVNVVNLVFTGTKSTFIKIVKEDFVCLLLDYQGKRNSLLD